MITTTHDHHMAAIDARAVRGGQYARWWIVLWVLFCVSRIVILVLLSGRGSDLAVQRGYAALIIHGKVPFRDFAPEYPPLVFAFTLVPAMIDRSLRWYFPIFRGLCCAVDCGVWVLLLRMNRAHPLRALLYIVCTTALGPVIYDRIDIVLGATLLLALDSLFRGRRRAFLALIGSAIAFKLIPLVLAPAILAAQARQSPRSVWRAILLLLFVPAVSAGVTMALGGFRLGELVRFHTNRGIQLESAPASIEMYMMQFGVPGTVSYEFGSVNLHTAYEPELVWGATAALLTLVGSGMWLAWGAARDRGSFALLLAGILSGSLALSKVLSPQYFVFLLPVLLAIPSPLDRAALLVNAVAILFIYFVTGIVFPWMYTMLMALHPAAVGLIVFRNEALVIMAGSLLWRGWCRHSHEITTDPGH